MNERIKELDKAAQEYAGTMAGNDEDSNYVEWFNIYKKTFAELIVKECIQTIQNESMNSGDEWEDGLRIAQGAIQEHLGVEG